MRLEKVDLNLFVVFDTMYRERSVTKVAQVLNLTQPGVSNALRRLRATFEDPLFVRSAQGMAPTPVAQAVQNDVHKALTLLGKSVGGQQKFDALQSQQHFKLGMNDLAQSILLPVLLPKMKALAPGVTLSTYYTDRYQAAEELKSGDLDLLIDAPAINARDLGQQSFMQLPYVVAMRQQHPLAHNHIDLDDYLASQHIHVSSRKKGRGQADLALHGMGKKRKISLRVQNYLVAAAVTANNDMLWTVPEMLVKNGALHLQPLPFTVEPLTLNLYWYKSAAEDPANLWLRQVVAQLHLT